MSMFLNDEQKLMQESVRKFTMEEVSKRVNEVDKSNEFPMDLWKRCAELGLTGVAIEEKYGGIAQGPVTELLVMEELSKEMPTLGLILDAHMLTMRTLEFFASEELKQKYLVPGAKGEKISAYAITDVAGSSNYMEWTPIGVYDGDDIVLNNTKLFCTNSHIADFYCFQGFIEGKLYGIIVDKGTPGLESGQIEHKMGLAGTYTGTVYLKDCRVPKTNAILMGSDDRISLAFLNISVIALGLAEGVFEKTKAFVSTRSRMKNPLSSYQTVAHHIAKMAAQIEFARNFIYNAAQLYEEGRPNVMYTRMAKALIPDMVVALTAQCVQMHGGLGYCEDTGIARYMRDAPGLTIGEFPTDIHWDVIAKMLGMPITTS